MELLLCLGVYEAITIIEMDLIDRIHKCRSRFLMETNSLLTTEHIVPVGEILGFGMRVNLKPVLRPLTYMGLETRARGGTV